MIKNQRDNMQKLTYLKNLDSLRFFAASYTIFFHYWSFSGNDILNNFVSHGHISVSFFFILSGYVLSYSYHHEKFSHLNQFLKFIRNRLYRLAPLYYLSLILSLPLYFKHLEKISLTILDHIIVIFSHLSFTQALIPSSKFLSVWNIHTWSLSVEAYLYILCPLILIWVNNKAKTNLIRFFFIITCINTSIYFYYFFNPNFIQIIPNNFAPLYTGLFAVGIIAAKYYIRFKEKLSSYSKLLFWGSTLLLTVLFILDLEKSFYNALNPIINISFLLLILGASDENNSTRFLSHKVLKKLGESSYAMYILQAPIKILTQQIYSKVLGFENMTGWIYNLTVYLSIVVVSLFITNYYDKFFRNILKRLSLQ